MRRLVLVALLAAGCGAPGAGGGDAALGTAIDPAERMGNGGVLIGHFAGPMNATAGRSCVFREDLAGARGEFSVRRRDPTHLVLAWRVTETIGDAAAPALPTCSITLLTTDPNVARPDGTQDCSGVAISGGEVRGIYTTSVSFDLQGNDFCFTVFGTPR